MKAWLFAGLWLVHIELLDISDCSPISFPKKDTAFASTTTSTTTGYIGSDPSSEDYPVSSDTTS